MRFIDCERCGAQNVSPGRAGVVCLPCEASAGDSRRDAFAVVPPAWYAVNEEPSEAYAAAFETERGARAWVEAISGATSHRLRAVPRCSAFDDEDDPKGLPRCVLPARWIAGGGAAPEVVACDVCHARALREDDNAKTPEADRLTWSRMPGSVAPGSWVCRRCGSDDVQLARWVYANTDEVLDDFGDDEDTTWCGACESHPGLSSLEQFDAEAARKAARVKP